MGPHLVLEAEVSGQRLLAEVLRYRQAAEEVLVLWPQGGRDCVELRWPLPSWSKDAEAVQHGHAGDVTAPMPGRVVKVAVAEGDEVRA